MTEVQRFGPLRERPFRLLWLARTGSSVGDSLIPVALAFPEVRALRRRAEPEPALSPL